MIINKNQGQTLKCACRECRTNTKHLVVVDASESGTASTTWDPDYPINWTSDYQLVRCQGCDTLSFRRAISNSEKWPVEIAPGEWEDFVHEDIYPSPVEGRTPIADANALPPEVERIYTETLSALNNRQKILCGIGIRAIIETVCKDKQTLKNNLYNRIDELVTLGVLTQNGAGILHKLRSLGNKAAHEVEPHSLLELDLALDVLDHLLLGVYILPMHAKKTFK